MKWAALVFGLLFLGSMAAVFELPAPLYLLAAICSWAFEFGCLLALVAWGEDRARKRQL